MNAAPDGWYWWVCKPCQMMYRSATLNHGFACICGRPLLVWPEAR
jgi:hypothetical protein